MLAVGTGRPMCRLMKARITGPSLSTNSVLSAANARKNSVEDRPLIPFEIPLSSVVRISGIGVLHVLLDALRVVHAEVVEPALDLVQRRGSPSPRCRPSSRRRRRRRGRRSARRSRRARSARGSRRRCGGRGGPPASVTSGPATAPSTVASSTGMKIVDVSSSSQIRPTRTSTKPTTSQELKPVVLSQVGAVNCGTLRSVVMAGDDRPPPGRSHHPAGMKIRGSGFHPMRVMERRRSGR